MIDLRFVPLEQPIDPPGGRYAPSRFACTWGTLLDDLEIELHALDASSIIVEADLRKDQIRNDGWPRGGCSPATPGVRLSFASKHGPMAFACGTFRTMEQNLRAIGLTLQRLRLIDEYGATRSGEQYKGFAQLPAGEWSTIEAARNWLGTMAGCSGTDTDIYRAAARKAHPDAGGSNDLMAKVNRARDFIENHKRA